MIQYDEKANIFKIDTQTTSYVIGIADGRYAGHVYYGQRLDSTELSYLLRTEEAPYVPSENMREKATFLDTFPMEYSFGGTGDFRESCLEVVTADGQRGLELVYAGYRIYEGKEALSGLPATWGGHAETLVLTLADEVNGVRAELSYSVFADCDAIMRSVRIKNDGEREVCLDRVLSACLDMDNENFEVLSLHGSWARERHIQRRALGYGSCAAESVRGESSHQEHPFLALVTPECTQTCGEVYAMHFIYSGNFLAKAQRTQHDSVRLVMGIHPERFGWRLAPGACFQAPEVVLVYSDAGLGKMSRTLHDLYRGHLIRGSYRDKERPVLVNSWEAAYFDFDSDTLLDLARDAAELGIEMLVMDDGWFGVRNSDEGSLGDWEVNEKKLKGGLKKLVDGVNELGMKFGIWFEPEMISPDSALYREHPDWALHVKGREPSMCRAQYVLDFSRPEVVDYVYGCLRSVLKSANIEYVKWDMNRQLTDVGSSYLPADRQCELSHRHTLAVYELQERLVREFPNVLLENCSGGGARFDPGMLYYSPQIWCSDDTDAIERLMIQEGTQLLYPLSTIGAHVSDCPNHICGRTTPFETRGIVALSGTFGYELDPRRLSGAERAMIPAQIADYKKYGALIRRGDYYRIASYGENHLFDCYEVAEKDGSRALVFYVQVLCEPNRRSRRLRLLGLVPQACYEVGGARYSGRVLMAAGLLIAPRPGDFQARVIEVRMISEKPDS